MLVISFTTKNYFCLLLMLGMLLFAYSPASADDTMLRGSLVSDTELDNVHGGFLNSNGNFIYFSMDYMRFRYLSQNDPGSSGTNGYFSSLSQRALITENGIGVDLQIMQAGGPESAASNDQYALQPEAFSTTQVSIFDNQGFVNANIINGNYNTAAITNVINLQIGFFQVTDTSVIRSTLSNWVPLFY